MVLDLKALKKLINEEIVNKVDHKNLNIDVDFLKGVIPTAENIAIHFWNIIEPKIESGILHEVKLFESERNFVVYHGDSIERPH
jgi:6-pyruvoyltetrahydropterin/6-carboxytetrahydropterin synthase